MGSKQIIFCGKHKNEPLKPPSRNGRYPAVGSVGSWQLSARGSFGTSLSGRAKVTFYSRARWPTTEQGNDTRAWASEAQANAEFLSWEISVPELPLGLTETLAGLLLSLMGPLTRSCLFPGVTQGRLPGEPNLRHVPTTKGLIVRVEILMKVFI